MHDTMWSSFRWLKPLVCMQIAWWWKLNEQFSSEIEAQTEVFGGDVGAKRRKDLQLRLTEHNILVVSKYYRQLRLSRLATLLDLSEDEVRHYTHYDPDCVPYVNKPEEPCT